MRKISPLDDLPQLGKKKQFPHVSPHFAVVRPIRQISDIRSKEPKRFFLPFTSPWSFMSEVGVERPVQWTAGQLVGDVEVKLSLIACHERC